MTRLTFPDEGSRSAQYVDAAGRVYGAINGTALVYTDAGATTLADLRDGSGSALPVASTLTLDTYGRLPIFQGPNDGTDTLYVKVNSGPVTAVYARSDDRLDLITATGTANAAAIAAEATARAAADALLAPLASPALTGNPTAPTQTAGNSSTRVATTAFTTGAIATQAAADAGSYAPKAGVTPSVASAVRKVAYGTAPTIVLTGNSLLYGQDTSGTGTQASANGAGQTRNPNAPSLVLAGYLSTLWGGVTPTIVNQTYPGDQTDDVITRWASGSSGDIEVFLVDTNDTAAFGTAGQTIAQSVANLDTLIQRAHGRGAAVVVMAGTPVQDDTNHRKVRAYAEAHRQVAARYGAPFLDVDQLLRGLTTAAVWTDGVHLTSNAYGLMTARLAAAIGGAFIAPKAAVGSVWSPDSHGNFGGGAVTTRSNSIDGRVLRLTSGQSVAIPVDVLEPCRPLIDFNSDGNGVGAGTIIHAFGAAGVNPLALNMAAAAGTGYGVVRGQPLRSVGPDVIIVSCTSGALEIERIRFAPVTADLTFNGDTTTAKSAHGSSLTGRTVQARGSATYDSFADENTPVSTLSDSGTTYTCDAEFAVRLPASGFTGVGLLSSVNHGDELLRGTGYIATRSGTDLVIKNAGDLSNVTTVNTVFPSGATYDGVITLRLTGNDLAFYVDGVLKYTVTGATWKHYVPSVHAQGSAATVLACTVRRY